jgi:hypothetical protein
MVGDMSTSAAGGSGMTEAYEAPALTEFGTIEELTQQIDISIIIAPDD